MGIFAFFLLIAGLGSAVLIEVDNEAEDTREGEVDFPETDAQDRVS